MAHAHAETNNGFSSSADINMPVLWITGVMGTMIVAVIVLFAMAAFQMILQKEHEKKVVDQPNMVDTLKAEQLATIEPGIDVAKSHLASHYAEQHGESNHHHGPNTHGHDHNH